MNPFPVVVADFRHRPATALAIVVLIALAVALGVAISAQERALRKGGARAADAFDLLIGAPGSETQLVLTTVFLQPAPLPLVSGELLRKLDSDPRVAGAAPVAYGDFHRGMPVVGTSAAFVTRFGALTLAEGRNFAAMGEVVTGADTGAPLGYEFHPAHGQDGEGQHVHDGDTYRVVGRLPRTGTPWDRAFLVPIESVWETHALPTGHEEHEADADAAIGPPWGSDRLAGVPAIVVKPRSIADAYALRGAYRRDGVNAVFPGEILVSLYAVLGDIRDLLSLIAIGTQVLVLAAILMTILLAVGQRARQMAVLRALGASRLYVFLVIWLQTVLQVATGAALGLTGGWGFAHVIAIAVEARTGLALPVTLGGGEVVLAAALVLAGGALALLPALIAYRMPVARGLRG